MKKIYIVFLICVFLNPIDIFASNNISSDRLFFQNYDAHSCAMGNSIASFSNNSFSCINSPSTNFNFLSKRMDFSFVSLLSNIYAGAYAISMPFSFGNFTLAGSYNMYPSKTIYVNQENYLKDNSVIYLNYVLPIFKSYPVYDNIGGIGITIKGCKLDFNDLSKVIYSCDFGAHYKLYMIDDDFFAVMTVKNIGNNKINLGGQNLIESLENFDFALRYNFKGISKFALVADMIKFFNDSNIGYACGAEISPIYPATFKIGYTDYNNGFLKGVTTGIFLNFDLFNIGYAFSGINSTEAKHTLNMGFMFGGIRDMNKAYKYYLGVNFINAKDAYRKKDFINARQMFENILAVYPTHEPSKKYLQKIIYELDVQEKALEVSVNKFLRKAQKEYENNNLIKARIYYKEVLGVDTANAQALAGVAKIDKILKEISIDENAKTNAKKIISLWQKGVEFYNEKNFVFAKEKFEEIVSIDSKNPGAIKYLNLITTRLSNITAVQAKVIFEQGMRYYNEKNYKEAARYFSAVYVIDPNMSQAKKYYILSKKALKEKYDDIDLFKDENFLGFTVENNPHTSKNKNIQKNIKRKH